MSISSNGYHVFDARLARIAGFKLLGGYGLRLGVDFTTTSWRMTQGELPVVVLHPANVFLNGAMPELLGRAIPETPMPFSVTEFSLGPTGAGFELTLSPASLEKIEEMRKGGAVSLTVRLCAEVRQGREVRIVSDDLREEFNQSHWLRVLEGCGYQRTMLFELPIVEGLPPEEQWARAIGTARQRFLAGHYPEAVAACRAALESLNRQLGQVDELKAVVEKHKKQRKDLSAAERELVIRQSAFDFASLAVHTDGGEPEDLFDRSSAQMMIAVTASLIASASSRIARIRRETPAPSILGG